MGKVAFEMVSIIVAVFIALAVDEWWEQRENQEEAEASLQRIVTEIRQNREDLIDDQAFHKAQLEQTRPLIELVQNDQPIPEGTEWELGVDVSLLSDTAWKTAQMTGAFRYLPEEVVHDLANIYAIQEMYGRHTARFFMEIGNINFISAERIEKMLSAYHNVSFLYDMETTLMSAYDGFLSSNPAGSD